jgi:hypothetical protein
VVERNGDHRLSICRVKLNSVDNMAGQADRQGGLAGAPHAAAHSDTLNEQLRTALNSRVITEQTKGKLAERLGIDVAQAFTILRGAARNRIAAYPA